MTLDSLAQIIRRPHAEQVAAQRELAVLAPDGTIIEGQDTPPEGARPREASVLLIVYPADGDLHTLLTLRTEGLPEHAGQISFPGGSRERHDDTLLATALRETEEEIGVSREHLAVVGELAPVWIPVTGYHVQPWVATATDRPETHPDPTEVAEILDVSLGELTADDAIERELRTLRGRDYLVPYYRHGEHKIWGATARMVAMLVDGLRSAVA